MFISLDRIKMQRFALGKIFAFFTQTPMCVLLIWGTTFAFALCSNHPVVLQIQVWRQHFADELIAGGSNGVLQKLLLGSGLGIHLGVDSSLWRMAGFVHIFSLAGIHISFLDDLLAILTRKFSNGFRIYSFLRLFFLMTLLMLQAGRVGLARVISYIYLRSWAREFDVHPIVRLLFLALLEGAMSIVAIKLGVQEWPIGLEHFLLALLGPIWFSKEAQRRNPKYLGIRLITRHLWLSVASWIFTVPFDVWSDGSFTFATPIVSLVTIPLLCFLGLPLTIFSLLSDWFLPGMHAVEDFLVFFESLITNFPFRWIISFSNFLLGLCIFLICFFCFSRIWKGMSYVRVRWFIFFFGILIRVAYELLLKADPVRFVLFDVGQGESWALIGSEGSLIVDTGSRRSSTSVDWVRRLSQMQLRFPLTVWITHVDEDHSGGLDRLAAVAAIQNLHVFDARQSWPPRLLRAAADIPMGFSPDISAGVLFQNIRVFTFSRRSTWSTNDRAPLMDILLTCPLDGQRLGVRSFADASASLEDRAPPFSWAVDQRILKVSHHGSRFSSSLNFLQNFAPDFALISAGRRNRYGHPHPLVRSRLESLGARVLTTLHFGTIEVNPCHQAWRVKGSGLHSKL